MKESDDKKKVILSEYKDKLLPFTLTGIIVFLDQLSKHIIVKNWPRIGTIIKDVLNNDFFRIVHVRNKAIAFSLGRNVPDTLRPILFIAIPLLVLGFLCWYYFKSSDFTRLQRWAAAGIIGGGLGNIIDRIFRPDGVVDFIDVKFFGIAGIPILRWERWPVFNIADSSVVVCCMILFLTILISSKKSSAKSEHE